MLLKELINDPRADEFGHALIDVSTPARARPPSTPRSSTAPSMDRRARLAGGASPGEAYAHLIAGRSLQRLNRRDEAVRHLKLAEALGGYRA